MRANYMRFVLVGMPSSGKTAIERRFGQNIFVDNPPLTMGEPYRKLVTGGSKSSVVEVWDTAGVERFRALSKMYYRGASAVLVVFDVCNRDTFDTIAQWVNEAREHNSTAFIMLVGNKIDFENRTVTKQEAEELSLKMNVQYHEISAKTAEGFQEMLERCVDSAEFQQPVGAVVQYNTHKRSCC